MNLSMFLKEIDTHTARMTTEEMRAFIHEIARTLPAEKREKFLSMFADRTEAMQEDAEIPESLLEQLERIRSGELRLDAQIHEEYDDWYDSEETLFDFEDGDGLLDSIAAACTELHELLNRGAYTEAYPLGRELLTLTVQTDGDYVGDTDTSMNLYELEYYDLLQTPLKDILLEVLCAAYFALPPEEKSAVIYQLGKTFQHVKWTLEELMQSSSEELPGLEDFLSKWIAYLASVPEQDAERLLTEAIQMQNVPEQALETARKFVSVHPVLYEQVLTMQTDDTARLTVGMEALQKTDTCYLIRSELALQTAETALRLGLTKEAEFCRMEAFRSETTPENYLRALLNSPDFAACQTELAEICQNLSSGRSSADDWNAPDSQQKNIVTDKTSRFIAFLNGAFQNAYADVQERFSRYECPVLNQGAALTALFLYSGEVLPEGLQTMCRYLVQTLPFDAGAFSRGVPVCAEKDSTELLWKCLQECRTYRPLADCADALDTLRKCCTSATEYVMHNDMRAQYEDCAVLAAAVGELMEADGLVRKNDYLLECKAVYPRRIAYHRELRKYGMRDGK